MTSINVYNVIYGTSGHQSRVKSIERYINCTTSNGSILMLSCKITFRTKVYRITESGSQALQAWLQTPLDDGEANEIWLTQLFFGSLIDSDQVQALVQARIDNRQQRLEDLHEKQADLNERDASNRMIVLQELSVAHQIARVEAEIGWLQMTYEHIAEV